jgi:monovalent cation:H+ antiporter-2, CPA2 family
VLIIGRTILRPLFHIVSRGWSFELFTLTVLFVSLAAAFATKSLGLSMAFGAFLAGMMLGETEFRHQVESAIRPFRDVLLGLFFISIGMLLDPTLLPDIWFQALFGALALLGLKLALVTAIARASGVDLQTALRTGMVLAVGGEFGFALLALGLGGEVIEPRIAQIVLNAVFFSMILGPFLIRLNQPVAMAVCRMLPRVKAHEDALAGPEPISPKRNHVIICGFGRIGQVVGRFLEGEKVDYLALDMDPTIVRESRLAGQPVYFGDSSDLSVLESAGLADAALMVISHDDTTAALRSLEAARAINPGVPIVVRSRDATHVSALRKAGATEVIPETLEAGMMIASHAMMLMKVPTRKVAELLRHHQSDRYRLVRELFRGQTGLRRPSVNADGEQLHSVMLDTASPATGRSLGDIDRELDEVTVTTLVRDGHRLQQPAPETSLKAGDVLVLLGTPDALDRAESGLTGGQPAQ